MTSGKRTKGKAHFMPGRSKDRTNIRKQKAKFPKLIEDIIRISDLILEVLDARFIQETRNLELEEEIKKQGKKLIYVLNKADLVDISKTRKEIPKDMKPHVFVSSKSRRGMSELREKIKMEIRRLNLVVVGWDRAQVGIIGYPNTGKSSLINTLTGRSSAKTGAQAGFTRGIQKISLTKKILVLDTPGVIPESKYSHSKTEAIQEQAKIGARTLDTIRDPEMVVEGLLKDYAEQIGNHYGLLFSKDSSPRDDTGVPSVENVIQAVGKKKMLLKRGNLIDEDRAARMIIKDWQEGKIKI